MSGIRHDVDEMCAIVACYTALPTFRDNLLVSFSRVKNAKKKVWVRNYQYALRSDTQERRSRVLPYSYVLKYMSV